MGNPIKLYALREELALRHSDLTTLLGLAENCNKDDRVYSVVVASICLAAYNQIEFVSRQIVLNTCDEIIRTEKHYFDITKEIKKHLLGTAKKQASETGLESLFARQACTYRPKESDITNGNIDFSTLRRLAETYSIHFSWPRHPTITLDTLKDIRNQLAHGETAFSQINYTIADLKEFVAYIEELSLAIVDGIEISLNDKKYCMTEQN